MSRKDSVLGLALMVALGGASAALVACSSKGATGGVGNGGDAGNDTDGGDPGSSGTAGSGARSGGGTSGGGGPSGDAPSAGAPGGGTPGGGAAGSGGAGPECNDASDCPEPADECLAATCTVGECGVGDAAAGTECTEGVCNGAGSCGECVPEATTCLDGRPQLCNAAGEWVPQAVCTTFSRCNAGRCRGLVREWHLQTGGTAFNEMGNLALDTAGNVYVSGNFMTSLEFGGRNLTDPATQDAFFARVPATGQVTHLLVGMGSSGSDFAPVVSVAGNGNHFVTFEAQGPLARGPVTGSPVGATEPFVPVTGFGGNGVLRFGQSFRSRTGSVSPEVYLATLVPAPDGTTAYMVTEFVNGVRWTPAMAAFQDLVLADCHTLVAGLDALGRPAWSATYDWCNGSGAGTRRPTVLGSDGNLYIAGPAGRRTQAGSAPSLIGTRALTSLSSAVIVKASTTNGSVLELNEMACPTSGNVSALANGPGNQLIAVVSCNAPGMLTLGTQELPGGVYVVKFDQNLRPVDHQLVSNIFGPVVTAMAVSPDGAVFLAGEFFTFGDALDFGAGPHTYRGSCNRCRHFDAFLVGYSPELELMFSRTFGSPSEDWSRGVAATNTHVYFALNFGDTIDILGETLNRTGTGSSSVLVKYRLQ